MALNYKTTPLGKDMAQEMPTQVTGLDAMLPV